MRRGAHLRRQRAISRSLLSHRNALRRLRRRGCLILSLGSADAPAPRLRSAGDDRVRHRFGDRVCLRVEERRIPVAVDSPGQFLLGKVDEVARWAQSSSVWPLTMGLACCAIEMMTATAPEYDIARFGSEVFRASPRQADLMIVSGRVAQKMAPVVRRLWEQM